MDQKDINVFNKYLETSLKKTKVRLLCKALVKNHFHLLVKQKRPRDIVKLMKSLGTRYTLYFNYRYERVGPLFQGTYKARLVKGAYELMIVTKYIESNKTDDLG